MFAREAAERAYRFKSDFVANVSHELRTPLNLIIGFSEMMATAPESYGNVQLPREYRGDIMAIYRSAKHLSDLINDVLDLSQIEAGHMPINKESTDLGEVVREATDIVRGLVAARGLSLEVHIDDNLPRIRLDRTRIRQVLLNLLTNATRFTDAGFIRTSVRLANDEGAPCPAEAIIGVEDSGRGIPPDKLARAFEAFTQLHDDQIREGTGLGLAVSKRFIQLHGGRMWIESHEGVGTTVGFALPIVDTHLSEPRLSAALRMSGEKPAVLVLHNDPRALTLLRRYIDGYSFAMARTVQQAREALDREPPIAILADPSWLGHSPEALAQLHLPDTMPVITATLPGLRRTGVLIGAMDYLSKPVTREALTEALERLSVPLRRVLIVDDDPHVVRLLSRMIKAEDPDVAVLEAFDGASSLQIAREQQPDALLLDLLMPDMSGYEVLKVMSEDPELSRVPVIIVSARGLDDEAARIDADVQISRAVGLTTTEMLRLVSSSLTGVAGLAH
jgi:CheY-like chemotaxis protein